MAKPEFPLRFETDRQQRPLTQAVSLALAILGAARVSSWEELPADVFTADDGVSTVKVALTSDQVELLRAHFGVVSLVSPTIVASKQRSGNVRRSVAVCPACDRWMFVSSSTAPKRCTLTLGCDEKLQVAKPAAKATSPEPETVPAPSAFTPSLFPTPTGSDET